MGQASRDGVDKWAGLWRKLGALLRAVVEDIQMIRLIALVLFVCNMAPALAHMVQAVAPEVGSINGAVKSKEGKPIAGADITVSLAGPEHKTDVQTVKADSDGKYLVKKLSPGAYEVTAAASGYEPKTLKAQVKRFESTELDVELLSKKANQR
jgi:hypothetical protein